MGRRSITLLTALLLATALAAGAGDNKWSKSGELEYFPLTNTFRDVKIKEDKAQDKYTVSWYPLTRMNPVEFIDVTYISWELYCAALKTRTLEGKILETKADIINAEARESFLDLALFTVAVSVNDSSLDDLLLPENWTAVAEVEGEFVETTVSGRYSVIPMATLYIFAMRNTTTISESIGEYWFIREPIPQVTTFFVSFKPPENWEPCKGMKLILSSKDVARGFEWRFKED
jgi:hypothetical protein